MELGCWVEPGTLESGDEVLAGHAEVDTARLDSADVAVTTPALAGASAPQAGSAATTAAMSAKTRIVQLARRTADITSWFPATSLAPHGAPGNRGDPRSPTLRMAPDPRTKGPTRLRSKSLTPVTVRAGSCVVGPRSPLAPHPSGVLEQLRHPRERDAPVRHAPHRLARRHPHRQGPIRTRPRDAKVLGHLRDGEQPERAVRTVVRPTNPGAHRRPRPPRMPRPRQWRDGQVAIGEHANECGGGDTQERRKLRPPKHAGRGALSWTGGVVLMVGEQGQHNGEETTSAHSSSTGCRTISISTSRTLPSWTTGRWPQPS